MKKSYQIIQMAIGNLVKYFPLILMAISFPFLAIFFLPLRALIYVFLKLKHGDKFYGILNGYENVFEIDGTSRGLINILFIFEYDASKNGDVLECMKKHILKPEIVQACRKASTRRRRLLGYSYLIEPDSHEGLVQALPAYDSEEDIRRILSAYSNEPMGDDDDKMLEFHVGTKPISFTGIANLAYPIIAKAHHCVGDGVSLINLFATGLAREPVAFLKKTDDDFRSLLRMRSKPAQQLKNTESTQTHQWSEKGALQLGKLWRKVMTSKFYHPLGSADPNLLHGKALTGNKNLVWGRGKSSDYVKMVKNIKSRFEGVSFINVLFAAIAASISEYYQKHDPENVPEHITNGVTMLPFIPKFEDLVDIRNGRVESLDLTNKFIVTFLKLPLVCKGNIGEHVVELVGRIKNEFTSLSQSCDILLFSFVIKYILYYMPMAFCQFMMNYYDSTICVSNLPGMSKLEMFHGGYINSTYFWPPNVLKNGFAVSVFTYDNRLRIGLIVDEAIIPHSRDAQEIVDNVFKYLDVLDATSQVKINNN